MARKKPSFDEEAFLEHIINDPDDDPPRLIYADWLEERGDPRGEFIRLQCQRATINRHHADWNGLMDREIKLLKQYGDQWLGGVPGLHFRRGFVEEIQISGGHLPREAARLLRMFPTIRHLRIAKLEDHWPDLAQAALLERIELLDLSFNELGRRPLEALFSSPYCKRLKSLKLEGCGLNSASVACFADAPALKTLRELDVHRNGLGAEGVRTLVQSKDLANLRQLNLAECHLSNKDITALTDGATFRLESLSLGSTYAHLEQGMNQLGNEGATMLAQCSLLADLKALHLGHNQISNLGLRALTASPHLGQLEELKLNNNRISDQGLAIFESPLTFPKLIHLDVNYNEFSRKAAEGLQSKRPQLRISSTGAR